MSSAWSSSGLRKRFPHLHCFSSLKSDGWRMTYCSSHGTKILPPSGWGRESNRPVTPHQHLPSGTACTPASGTASLLPTGVTETRHLLCGHGPAPEEPCMALAKHHCPSFAPGLCSCLAVFSHSVWCPCSRSVRVEAHLFSRQPQEEVAGAAVLRQDVLEQERCHILCSLRSCWPCLPLQSQSRHIQAGADQEPDGNLAPMHRRGPCGLLGSAAAVGEAARPPPYSLWPWQGCAQGQQPCHTGKDCRRSTTCDPSTVASSSDLRESISSL